MPRSPGGQSCRKADPSPLPRCRPPASSYLWPVLSLPPAVETLVDELASMDGVVAVALGGSRALGVADAGSDWDLAVYYRKALDTTALARRGTVHPPGAWGRIMNGGAWLRGEDGAKIDVLLRDRDVADLWSA